MKYLVAILALASCLLTPAALAQTGTGDSSDAPVGEAPVIGPGTQVYTRDDIPDHDIAWPNGRGRVVINCEFSNGGVFSRCVVELETHHGYAKIAALKMLKEGHVKENVAAGSWHRYTFVFGDA